MAAADMADSMAADMKQLLDASGDYLHAIPYVLRVVGLCTVCATIADDIRDKYLLHFWVTYLAGWGGGLSSAILLNKPLELPVSMFINAHDVVIVVVWWLANYCPGGLPGKVMRLKPVQLVSLALLQMLRASTICTVMTMTHKYYPQATIAVLIMGCIGGSGGKVWHDIVRGGYGISKGADEVSVPGTSLHGSFVAAVLHFWLTIYSTALTFRQSHTLLSIFLAVQSLLLDLTGFNLLDPPLAVLYTLGNLPKPNRSAAKVVKDWRNSTSTSSAGSKKTK